MSLTLGRPMTTKHSESLDAIFPSVSQSPDAKQVKKLAWHPIHVAAAEGHLDIVKCFVSLGEDVNVEDSEGWRPIHSAAQEGQLEVVQYLVSKGADVTIGDDEGWTPLHAAAQEGHLGILKYLVSHGADVNTADSTGWTVLHAAAHEGLGTIADFLVSKGGNLLARDKEGRTPLDIATLEGHSAMLKKSSMASTPPIERSVTPAHMSVNKCNSSTPITPHWQVKTSLQQESKCPSFLPDEEQTNCKIQKMLPIQDKNISIQVRYIDLPDTQMKSLFPKGARSTFVTSEKNAFLCASLYTRL